MRTYLFILCSLSLISSVINLYERCGPEYGKCDEEDCCSEDGYCVIGWGCMISEGCQPEYGFCENDIEDNYEPPNKGENLTPDGKEMKRRDYEKKIWDYLSLKLNGNKYAVAGVMGLFYLYSDLNPNYLTYKCEKKFGIDGETYTKKVDEGSQKHFVLDGCGYGLIEWSKKALKRRLLKYAKSKQKSVGDITIQIDFFLKELSEKDRDSFEDLLDSNSIYSAISTIGYDYFKEKHFSYYSGHFKDGLNSGRFYYNIYGKK